MSDTRVNRRRFVKLLGASLLVPEELIRGRSMVTVPPFGYLTGLNEHLIPIGHTGVKDKVIRVWIDGKETQSWVVDSRTGLISFRPPPSIRDRPASRLGFPQSEVQYEIDVGSVPIVYGKHLVEVEVT